MHSAELYTEELPFADGSSLSSHADLDPCPEEVHSFFIHKEGGGRLDTQVEQQ